MSPALLGSPGGRGRLWGFPPRRLQLGELVQGLAVLPFDGGEEGGCCSSAGSPASPGLSLSQEASDQGSSLLSVWSQRPWPPHLAQRGHDAQQTSPNSGSALPSAFPARGPCVCWVECSPWWASSRETHPGTEDMPWKRRKNPLSACVSVCLSVVAAVMTASSSWLRRTSSSSPCLFFPHSPFLSSGHGNVHGGILLFIYPRRSFGCVKAALISLCGFLHTRPRLFHFSNCFLCLAEDPLTLILLTPKHPGNLSRFARAGPPPWGTFAPGLFVCGKGRLLVKLSQWLKQHPRPAPLLNNCTVKADAVFLPCTFLWKTAVGSCPPSHVRGLPGSLRRRLSRVLVSCLTCSSGVFRMNGAVDKDWGCFSNCFLNNQTARQHFQKFVQTRPKAFLWSQVASETVFITCLSSPLCASLFAVVPSGLRAFHPGPWHQRLWRLPGVGRCTCPWHSEGSVGLEIFPQLGVPGIQAWP